MKTRVQVGPNHYRMVEWSPLPCVHLGELTGDAQECPTCTGKVLVKLHACAVHGRCSTDKLLPQVACCSICPDKRTA